TEEWARDLGQVTHEARDAYAAARDIAEAAGPPVSGSPGTPVDVPGPPQERADVPERAKVEEGRFI
ncbi:MAG TPA: hypothetical protein VD766_07915, partial [Solirubrobacterales bacterium]|nr:hypothetical protein [Solirubrobacterales bacterium]